MSVSVGRYAFLSWLRRGIGNRIGQDDRLGQGASGTLERATVDVQVLLNGDSRAKPFALIGPGDIIGINPQMAVRTEPVAWIADFEPNYLAFVEFYDEDFLWRYTPARAVGEKLSPWLALLILKEATEAAPGEFEASSRTSPLPSITVKTALLPSLADNWAMAHVHINEGHDDPGAFERFLLSLRKPGSENADKIIGRLMSPRHLDPVTAYRGFVVPAFETGRLAGLGQSPAGIDAQAPAWTGAAGSVELPVYYQWPFRTGENEDFELLVERLQPRPAHRDIGIRSMDSSVPGFGLAQPADIGAVVPPERVQSTLGLEGALRAPTTKSNPEALDLDRPFFPDLTDILNLPADRKQAALGETDPVVVPPIYGGPHALKDRLDHRDAGWLTELNRDPRLRVGSGFGTSVVQKHQEDYVARAWAQVKTILEQNRLTKLTKAGLEIGRTIEQSFYGKLSPGHLLALAKPVTKKVMGSPTTLHQRIGASRLANAPLDAAMRRLVAPRRPVGRRLLASDSKFSLGGLIGDIDEGRLTAAPPKPAPAGLPTDTGLAERAGQALPAWARLLLRWGWLILLALALAVLILLLLGFWPVALGLGLALGAATLAWLRARRLRLVARAFADPSALASAIRHAPPRPGFALVVSDPPQSLVDDAGGAASEAATAVMPPGRKARIVRFLSSGATGRDSVEGARFRAAASRLALRFAIRPVEPPRPELGLGAAAGKLRRAMQPERAWARMLASRVVLAFAPEWFGKPEHVVPAIAYPDFDDPMYEKLRDLSTEYFLPNLQLIADETITLLRTNPRFIEAYMVGLNQEFGHELLWREYPTDQRGSYFRQFWSVRGIIKPPTGTQSQEQGKSDYRDIDPIDRWGAPTVLGDHRPKARPRTGDLVLTIRGELLRKYPNTLIYAQRAHIARRKDGTPNPDGKPVILTVTSEAGMASEILFPMFAAEIAPDIRFFGFDLTAEKARGATEPRAESDDWGWYFIIQELPGEPRFGLDSKYQPDEDGSTPITWNDLSWDKMPAGGFLKPGVLPLAPFGAQPAGSLGNRWGKNSADMAAILFQRPVMVAIHAREMLEKLDA
jgi:hypothetical protein